MRYLIVRLTSLGNVAMSVPLVASLSAHYKDDEFVYVAQKELKDLFHGMPNVRYEQFLTPHSGNRLNRGIRLKEFVASLHDKTPFDAIIDWQSDCYTFLTRLWARRKRISVYTTDSPWLSQRIFIARHGKSTVPPNMVSTYLSALKKAGLECDNSFVALPPDKQAVEYVTRRFGEHTGGQTWIGIAPFAKSATNTLPFRTTKAIIQHFSSQPGTTVFLFGAGVVESEMLNQWSSLYDNVISVAGMLSIGCELELMRMLDGMICMDSANQHLASLVGLQVTVIWGGTAPENGFLAWKQNMANCMEPQHHLNCRPCTLNGRKKCRRKTFECLNRYSVAQIIEHFTGNTLKAGNTKP